MIDLSIFKTYDVRGIYPKPFNKEAAEAIGIALVQYFKHPKEIVVGRDMRASSEPLFRALAGGIISEGSDVVDIGLVTNSGMSQTVALGGYKVGVMISASHNPPEYNGFKIVRAKGVQLSSETGLKEIAEIAMRQNTCHREDKRRRGRGDLAHTCVISTEAEGSLFVSKRDYLIRVSKHSGLATTGREGRVIKKDISKRYYDFILKLAKNIKPGLKVVIDAGNGIGGAFNKPVFDKLPIKYYSLYFKPDGAFPNHLANPAEDKNLRDIIAEVKNRRADLGIAFDGDADRAFFIDDKGQVVNPGFCLLLLAKDALAISADKRIYYDIRFPHIVPRELKKMGAVPVKTRVGNPFYKEQLIGQGGAMAAEVSGHIFFADGNGLDDGLIASIKMLEFASNQKAPLSQLIDNYSKQSCYPGEINLPVKNTAKVIEAIEDKYKTQGKIIELDGVTVELKDWWFNIRGSNTEPLLRLTIETKPDKVFFESKKKEIISAIEKIDKQASIVK